MDQKKSPKNRNFLYGTSSVSIAILIVGVVAVLNFVSGHNFFEADLTQDKIHAFSDQSQKVLKNLQGELKAELYADSATKDRFQAFFENYQKLSPLFKFEVVDLLKEPTRVKASGVKKIGTLSMTYQNRNVKVDTLTEEKVTQAILKLQKEKKLRICSLIGQGEASVEDFTQSGMQSLKAALEDQSYEVLERSIARDDISADCDGVTMLGVHGKIFPEELKAVADYLERGGRAVIALDAAMNAKDEPSSEFKEMLSHWGVSVKSGLIIDPEAKRLGVDASLITISFYNPHHAITRGSEQPSYFPFTRPIEYNSTVAEGLLTTSLAKTSDQAWAESDLNSFIKGEAQFDANRDSKGPLSVGVATQGKRKGSFAKRETRLVVFGSSQLVNNQYSRLGGNLDFFLNAMNWVLDDESSISIRAKDQEPGRVQLSQKEDSVIFWSIVIILPFASALMGFLVWLQRKRL